MQTIQGQIASCLAKETPIQGPDKKRIFPSKLSCFLPLILTYPLWSKLCWRGTSPRWQGPRSCDITPAACHYTSSRFPSFPACCIWPQDSQFRPSRQNINNKKVQVVIAFVSFPPVRMASNNAIKFSGTSPGPAQEMLRPGVDMTPCDSFGLRQEKLQRTVSVPSTMVIYTKGQSLLSFHNCLRTPIN